MYDNLARRAILAALASDWQEALAANLEILSEDPRDVDALNRAARAYLQLGEIENAVEFSKKVLHHDPLNPIADKCISKCSLLRTDSLIISKSARLSEDFLEIPGKTKIVALVNLCASSVLARLDAGDNVLMIPKVHKVAVTTPDETYIGRLPDDLATRIIYFIKSGNEYDTYIKSIAETHVKVFIKETKRAEDLNQIPSFPARRY